MVEVIIMVLQKKEQLHKTVTELVSFTNISPLIEKIDVFIRSESMDTNIDLNSVFIFSDESSISSYNAHLSNSELNRIEQDANNIMKQCKEINLNFIKDNHIKYFAGLMLKLKLATQKEMEYLIHRLPNNPSDNYIPDKLLQSTQSIIRDLGELDYNQLSKFYLLFIGSTSGMKSVLLICGIRKRMKEKLESIGVNCDILEEKLMQNQLKLVDGLVESLTGK